MSESVSCLLREATSCLVTVNPRMREVSIHLNGTMWWLSLYADKHLHVFMYVSERMLLCGVYVHLKQDELHADFHLLWRVLWILSCRCPSYPRPWWTASELSLPLKNRAKLLELHRTERSQISEEMQSSAQSRNRTQDNLQKGSLTPLGQDVRKETRQQGLASMSPPEFQVKQSKKKKQKRKDKCPLNASSFKIDR